jgi:hypothetical protein
VPAHNPPYATPDSPSLVRSTFQIRRVIWTKDVIAFARAGEEVLIDAIPLSEIKSIEAVGSRHLDGLAELDGRVRDQGSINLLPNELDNSAYSFEAKGHARYPQHRLHARSNIS